MAACGQSSIARHFVSQCFRASQELVPSCGHRRDSQNRWEPSDVFSCRNLRFLACAQLDDPLTLFHFEAADMCLPFWEPHLLCQPGVRFSAADAALLPVPVKDAMGFCALIPQGFIRNFSERTVCAPVTADPCAAVLTLIDALTLKTESFDSCGSVDLSCRYQMDRVAAVAADLRLFQMTSYLL